MNLCADQLVWKLAGPDRIVSLSHLAAESEVSNIAGEVAGIHLNHGSAEEVLPLEPDLIVAGRYTARSAVSLLRKLGYRVIELDLARSVSDIRKQTLRLGEVLGVQERAREMIANMDRRIRANRPSDEFPRPTAVNYQPNGFTAGPGSLIADVLVHAGFAPALADDSVTAYRHLPLELLVGNPPDVLIVDQSYSQYPALAYGLLTHPALNRMTTRIRRVVIPNRIWICGTPETAQAIERLAAVRKSWIEERGRRE
ncbi:MAG: ABC transporter substrate-binding protein [Rhodospirillales bacterium]|nr:ABC transporter substrate-binding protein [Rhodospirillales bacterium]